MRISLNWLRDYLDLRPEVDIAQISNSLTLAGLEVEGIDDVREKSARLSIGTIVAISKLKDETFSYELDFKGEKIFALGPKSELSPGMKVAFSERCGSQPKEQQFALATFSDLGFLVHVNDVIAFDQGFFGETAPENLSAVKEFDDVIFTLGITPNRADALSHLGVSRELSAILDTSARVPMLTPREMAGPTHEKVAIEIENADDCPRYACRIAENVIISESPFWLKMRLMAVGVRPINNVVDVTNFVMLSRGQPMHAFDYDKIFKDNARAKIVVRRATDGEKLITLDGQEIKLTIDDVVIADLNSPLALAGVIGGIDSAVQKSTTNVLLESAFFDPKNVRMTARRHGIITESSYRFERGCDPNGVVDALNYAARLLTEVAQAKICREPIDAYRKRIDPLEIKMRPERAQAVLGIDSDNFDQDLLRRKFSRLGIETVAKRGDAIYFRVPTHRSDLTREIDLIEEAARMIGYDKVKEVSISTAQEAASGFSLPTSLVVEKLREALSARGFSEAINYAFLNKEWQNQFTGSDESLLIELKNPLSDRYGVMRVSLMPGLVRNLQHNQRNQEKSVQLFEIGTVFLGSRGPDVKPMPASLFRKLDQDSFALEKPMLGGVMAGRTSYFAFDHAERSFDFYHAKGVLSEIFHLLGFNTQYPNANIVFEHGAKAVYFHPGESATIVYGSGEKSKILGSVGRIHPTVATNLDVSKDAQLFELDVEEIAEVMPTTIKFKSFSRFPIIERDVAFVVNEAVRVSDILEPASLADNAKDTLVSLRVFDIYRGKNIETGKKSVAVTMALQKEDRTLTDEEAESFVSHYVRLVESKTGAKMR